MPNISSLLWQHPKVCAQDWFDFSHDVSVPPFTIQNSPSIIGVDWSRSTTWTKSVNKNLNLGQKPKCLWVSTQTQDSSDISTITFITAITPPPMGELLLFLEFSLSLAASLIPRLFFFSTLCFLRLDWVSFLVPWLPMHYLKRKHLYFFFNVLFMREMEDGSGVPWWDRGVDMMQGKMTEETWDVIHWENQPWILILEAREVKLY